MAGVGDMKFRVYFDQVNQTRFDIEAKTEEEAINCARKLWKQSNGEPRGCVVETDKPRREADNAA